MTAGRWSRLAVGLLFLTPGCAIKEYLWEPTGRPIGGNSLIVSGSGSATPSELSPELAAAHEQYRAEKISAAESAYHKIAENTKNPPPVAEEARFFEAESLYKQDKYPKACDTYHKMLLDFPNGQYRAQAVRRMFDIANYWLEDTRTEMQAQREKRDGKRWMVIAPVVHLEKQKPFFDQEGRAFQALEQVHLNDIGGPLADKALFLAGGVKFYREDYKEADYYFTQIVEQHPNSPLAVQAIELAIIAKHMSTGGADYDGRKVAEARILVNTAMRAYPELAQKNNGFLERQMYSIDFQQAQKDYNTADFYRRTGHPGAALYMYEVVRRTYPTTKFAEEAAGQVAAIKQEFESGKYNQVETDAIAKTMDQLESLFAKKGTTPTAPGGPPPAPSNMLPAGGGGMGRP